jgi:hypothetical protein
LLDAVYDLSNHSIGAMRCLSGHLRPVMYVAMLICDNSP